MNKRILYAVVMTLVVIGMFGLPATVQAGAYPTQFVTSVTYQNTTAYTATVQFDFYAENSSTAISIARPDLPAMAGSSLYVGSVSAITSGFRGSAVLISSQKLVATLVQLPPSTSPVKNRPLSNGFDVGATSVLIPTVLKNTYNTNSIFTVQNVSADPADIEVTFVPTDGLPIVANINDLPSGAAKYYDMGAVTPVTATTFNGSVKIRALTGTVVATSMELSTTTTSTYAFEGISQGGNTVYMPSAFCKFGATASINSAYAVQNTDDALTATVTVTYSNGQAEPSVDILPGKKMSFPGCGTSGTLNPVGFIGAATITSVGAPVAVVGKIGGSGLSTAYVGFPTGYEKVALPYVRWTTSYWTAGTRQQVNIAIQNVGTAAIAAGTLAVDFYGRDGIKLGTITNPASIAIGGKWSTNASSINPEFGYYSDGSGGSAVVRGPAGSKLAVIARAATYLTSTTSAGEDYNAIPIP
jgi:hypothetical protein